MRKLLVADASKVVRASLAKQLADHFAVREEASGESAWQTLVLDSTMVAVISGVSLTRLDGFALLDRIRASKLSRLNQLPFFLVISSSFSDADRKAALMRGVSGFIIKGAASPSVESVVSALLETQASTPEAPYEGMAGLSEALPIVSVADEELEQIGEQSDVGISELMGQLGGLEDGEKDEDEATEGGYANEDAVFAQENLEDYLSRHLPGAVGGQGVGVLAFGLDGYDELLKRYGPDLASRTAQKFSVMLARKIRSEDCIGQLANGRVVIIAASTDAAICARFANRICKAMVSAQISVRGQRLDLTVSVGVAVAPDDGGELSGQELLQLAYDRLDTARRSGGNRVAANTGDQGTGQGNCETFVPLLKELLATTDPAVLRPGLGTVGMQLMPILRELEKSFRFGLPIEEMSKRLWDRARAERMMT